MGSRDRHRRRGRQNHQPEARPGLRGAVELARGAILDDHVGAHLGVIADGERVVTHSFECTLPGYRGWRWAVTVTRISRSKHITICETVLLPGDAALRAPVWVPWHERLQPGDLGGGRPAGTRSDDRAARPGYVLSDDAAVEEVAGSSAWVAVG
jgi:hypothetical protein